jgi:predicted XRE-type DNA-binding protein
MQAILNQYYHLLKQFKLGVLTEKDVKDYLKFSLNFSDIPNGDIFKFLNELKDTSRDFNNLYIKVILQEMTQIKGEKIEIQQKLFSCSEIGEILGVSRQQINNWNLQGGINKGIKKFYPSASIEKYISGKLKYEKRWNAFKNG